MVSAKTKRKPKRAASGRVSRTGQPSRSHLTVAELARFQEALLAKRGELLGDMEVIDDGTAADETSIADSLDNSRDRNARDDAFGLLEREWALLGEINAALARIEGGTYGICLGTGHPIHKARLVSCPWVRYGIEYAKSLESRRYVPSPESAFAASGGEHPLALATRPTLRLRKKLGASHEPVDLTVVVPVRRAAEGGQE